MVPALLAAGLAPAEDDAVAAGVVAWVAGVAVVDALAAGLVAFASFVLEPTTWLLVVVFGAVFFAAGVVAVATGAGAGRPS